VPLFQARKQCSPVLHTCEGGNTAEGNKRHCNIRLVSKIINFQSVISSILTFILKFGTIMSWMLYCLLICFYMPHYMPFFNTFLNCYINIINIISKTNNQLNMDQNDYRQNHRSFGYSIWEMHFVSMPIKFQLKHKLISTIIFTFSVGSRNDTFIFLNTPCSLYLVFSLDSHWHWLVY